jgi:hypothetical protein
MNEARSLLRHTLATIAYRGGKAIRNAGPSFGEYGSPDTSRTPGKILAHIGDLMDWGLAMCEGRREWHDSSPLAWEKECERFFASVKKFDDYLASDNPLQVSAEKLFQAPIADALTPRRTDRNAAKNGAHPDEKRILRHSRNYGGKSGPGSGTSAQGIRLNPLWK